MEMNFCRRCGTALTSTDGHVFTCTNNHTIFLSPAPTSSVFVITPDRQVLLGRRGIEPYKGALDSIGGFVEPGENFEQASAREVREESGLEPHEYSELRYLTSSINEYPYQGEVHPVVSPIFYTVLRTDRPLTGADDIVEIVKCPIDETSLAQIQATDVRAGFEALITHKDDLVL